MAEGGDLRDAPVGVAPSAGSVERPRSVAPKPVHLSVRGALATVTIDNPPVNALSRPVKAGIWAALDAIERQPQVRAILLRAAGRTWPVGADIGEFDEPPTQPSLADICDRIEVFGRPVIAVLHGTALGGGLELALAATARLAMAGTVLGLPEVALGLVPGAGGTRRLPRLVGAQAALGLMLSGLPVAAERAEAVGLIDGIIDAKAGPGVEPDPSSVDLAVMLALSLADSTPKPAPAHDDPITYLAAVSDARARLGAKRRLPAPSRIIDCVEAALLLPERQAAMVEATAFADLRDTPESRGLRHAFQVERAGHRHPRIAGVMPRNLSRIAVHGSGSVAAEIALVLLAAGYRVTLGATTREGVAEGLTRIAAAQEDQVVTGRVTPEARDAAWARVDGAIGSEIWRDVDLGIVTGSRTADAAREASAHMAAGAILAFDGGTADVSAAAAASGRPHAAIGLVWNARPTQSRLVEVVAPQGADPVAVATGIALVRATRSFGVVVREPVGSLLAQSVQQAADVVLHLGASPFDIDRAMTGWGMLTGPYRLRDAGGMAGVGAASPTARALAEAMATRGWDGMAAGRGFYRHEPDGPMIDDAVAVQDAAEVLTLLRGARDAVAMARGEGPVARPLPRMSASVIVRHMMAFVANQAARLLAADTVARPSDIDAIALHHLGFPRFRGGPMHWADETGLLQVRNVLRIQERVLGPQAAAMPIWDDLIRNGLHFANLNHN